MSSQLFVALVVLGSLPAGVYAWRARGALIVGPAVLITGAAAAWVLSENGTCGFSCSDGVSIAAIVAIVGVITTSVSVVSISLRKMGRQPTNLS